MNDGWTSDTTMAIEKSWANNDAHEASLSSCAISLRALLTNVQILEHARDEYLFMSVHYLTLPTPLTFVHQQLFSLCS